MNRLLFAITASLVFLAPFAHADRESEAVRKLSVNVTALREFREIFPRGFFLLEKRQGRLLLEGKTFLTPNYEFTLTVPVSWIEERDRLKIIGDMTFRLDDIRFVREVEPGEFSVDRREVARFGPEQWVRIVNAGGNFEQAGIPLLPGDTLPSLHRYRRFLEQRAVYNY